MNSLRDIGATATVIDNIIYLEQYDTRGRTLTNAIEDVVAFLSGLFDLRDMKIIYKKIIYKDSDGIIDEVRVLPSCHRVTYAKK